jgi:NADPH:quinone reductase-like Zn-dependent oxidoreductase
MATMKAIIQDTYGSADVLQFREIDRPPAGKGEVVVQVRAAGISRGTVHVMTGTPYLMRLVSGLRRPKNPVAGQDVAGTVAAVGPNVTRFSVGDEVFGIARGSFAEYAVAREKKLAHKPASLSFEQAAAMPVSGLTALRAIDAVRIRTGQTVLVVGASGGVGTYAVQLAAAAGATVTGVASTRKLDLVRDLGASDVVDYTHEDVADGSRTFDVILDIGGVTPVARLRRALTPTGTLAIIGGENGSTWSPGLGRQLHATVLNPFVRQRLIMVMNKEHHSGLERLAALAEDGSLASPVDYPFSLSDAADAVRHLEAGRAMGKVVITV